MGNREKSVHVSGALLEEARALKAVTGVPIKHMVADALQDYFATPDIRKYLARSRPKGVESTKPPLSREGAL